MCHGERDPNQYAHQLTPTWQNLGWYKSMTQVVAVVVIVARTWQFYLNWSTMIMLEVSTLEEGSLLSTKALMRLILVSSASVLSFNAPPSWEALASSSSSCLTKSCLESNADDIPASGLTPSIPLNSIILLDIFLSASTAPVFPPLLTQLLTSHGSHKYITMTFGRKEIFFSLSKFNADTVPLIWVVCVWQKFNYPC